MRTAALERAAPALGLEIVEAVARLVRESVRTYPAHCAHAVPRFENVRARISCAGLCRRVGQAGSPNATYAASSSFWSCAPRGRAAAWAATADERPPQRRHRARSPLSSAGPAVAERAPERVERRRRPRRDAGARSVRAAPAGRRRRVRAQPPLQRPHRCLSAGIDRRRESAPQSPSRSGSASARRAAGAPFGAARGRSAARRLRTSAATRSTALARRSRRSAGVPAALRAATAARSRPMAFSTFAPSTSSSA